MVKDKNKKRIIIIRKWADSFIWIKPEGMFDPTKINRLEATNGSEIEVAVELYMTLWVAARLNSVVWIVTHSDVGET